MKRKIKLISVLLLIALITAGCTTYQDEYQIEDRPYNYGETVEVSAEHGIKGEIHYRITLLDKLRGTDEVYEVIGEPNPWEPGTPRERKDEFIPDPERSDHYDEYTFLEVRVEVVSLEDTDDYTFYRDTQGFDGFWIENYGGDVKDLQASEVQALQPELIGTEITLEEGESVTFWMNNLTVEGNDYFLKYNTPYHQEIKFDL